MKNLIKPLVIVLVITQSTASFAQRVGIQAGLNLSTMLIKDDNDTYSDDFKNNPGFNAGLKGDFPFGDVFSLETGLLLSTKGYQSVEEILGIEYKVNLRTLNIEVPLTGKVGIDLGSIRVYGAIGPYIGFGLAGKTRSEVTVLGQTEKDENDIEWGSDEVDDDLKRLDYGLTAGAGIEISTLQIGVSYGMGLANISAFTGMGTTVNNRVLGISLAYYFEGN